MIVNYDVSPTNIFGSWLRTGACFENFKIYSLKLAKNAMPLFGFQPWGASTTTQLGEI